MRPKIQDAQIEEMILGYIRGVRPLAEVDNASVLDSKLRRILMHWTFWSSRPISNRASHWRFQTKTSSVAILILCAQSSTSFAARSNKPVSSSPAEAPHR